MQIHGLMDCVFKDNLNSLRVLILAVLLTILKVLFSGRLANYSN